MKNKINFFALFLLVSTLSFAQNGPEEQIMHLLKKYVSLVGFSADPDTSRAIGFPIDGVFKKNSFVYNDVSDGAIPISPSEYLRDIHLKDDEYGNMDLDLDYLCWKEQAKKNYVAYVKKTFKTKWKHKSVWLKFYIENNTQNWLISRIEKAEEFEDSDRDCIFDTEDACPKEKGPRQTKGCPDQDNDKVADKDDLCPDLAGLLSCKGCPDEDKDGFCNCKGIEGCPSPDECPEETGHSKGGCDDKDKDGLVGEEDRCPNLAGPRENGGCPPEDDDGDNIKDSSDDCPNTPGKLSTQGCPDEDKDGVADEGRGQYIDYCKDQPGVRRYYLKKYEKYCGCPDKDHDDIPDLVDACVDTIGPGKCPVCARFPWVFKFSGGVSIPVFTFQNNALINGLTGNWQAAGLAMNGWNAEIGFRYYLTNNKIGIGADLNYFFTPLNGPSFARNLKIYHTAQSTDYESIIPNGDPAYSILSLDICPSWQIRLARWGRYYG